MKMKARKGKYRPYLVGRGEQCAPCDPGSELRKGRSWSCRAMIIDGMGKKDKCTHGRGAM